MIHPVWRDYPIIDKELEEVKKLIVKDLRIHHPDVKAKILDYLDAPGKYLRAGLSLLLAYQVDSESISPAKRYFAASVEVLHLATLIHDDVIDDADRRRGIEALHKTYSNRIAIYAGDYLLAYSFRLLKNGIDLLPGEITTHDIMDNRVIERILAGELAQLLNQYKSDMTMKDYLKQIKGKTAFLFGLAFQLGAWTSQTNKEQLHAAFHAGQAVGMAFQLSDDLLDYQVTEEKLGKPVLQDIQNGIYTAPFLLALQKQPSLRHLLEKKETVNWSEQELQVLQMSISATKADEATILLIQKYLQKSHHFLDKLNLDNPTSIEYFLQKIMYRTS